MALHAGRKVDAGPDGKTDLASHIHVSNIERLKIWCSVGSDMDNGLWAILGARQGLASLYLENLSYERIRDYDWFTSYWETDVLKANPDESSVIKNIHALGERIDKALNLGLTLLSPRDSRFFKSVYVNRPREPQLLSWS